MIGRINGEPLAFVDPRGRLQGRRRLHRRALRAAQGAVRHVRGAPRLHPGRQRVDRLPPALHGHRRSARAPRPPAPGVLHRPRSRSAHGASPTEAQDQCMQPPMEGCGCSAYPENRTWEHARIRFVTLNVPGSNNNVGYDAASDARSALPQRGQPRAGFRTPPMRPRRRGVRGLVVAHPGRSVAIQEAGVQRACSSNSRRPPGMLGKPVLFVHGDTHTYRVGFSVRGIDHAAGNLRQPVRGLGEGERRPGRPTALQLRAPSSRPGEIGSDSN